MARERIGAAQARRIALAAQGFTSTRPGAARGAVTLRHVQRVIDAVGVVQIDSITVLTRSHEMPWFSRLGPYDVGLLRRAAQAPPRRLVEYWAHEASFITPSTHRLLRWRMARAASDAWAGMRSVAREHPGVVDAVRDQVSARGASTARSLEAALAGGSPRSRDARADAWGWNWSVVKRACEHLFWTGELSCASRTPSFERRYDLASRVLPPAVAAAPDPDPADAVRELVSLAARALGVATEPALRDYFRLRPEPARRAIIELVEAGELLPVAVEGWPRPAWVHAGAAWPRAVGARALLSPFDSLVFERTRTQELFGMRHRLEVYVPAPMRRHGYYVLPFLLGDTLVARVDLKADRRGGVLGVLAAWAQPSAPASTASELAQELALMAGWLGLERVDVADRGDLAAALAACVRGGRTQGPQGSTQGPGANSLASRS